MQLQQNLCLPIFVIFGVPVLAAILTIAVGLIVRRIYTSQSSPQPRVRRDSKEPLMPKGILFFLFFFIIFSFMDAFGYTAFTLCRIDVFIVVLLSVTTCITPSYLLYLL